jgi:hypothetical protein
LRARARGLLIFHRLLEGPPVRELVAALDALAAQDGLAGLAAYGALFRYLLEAPGSLMGRLAEALLYDENALGSAADSGPLLEAARADLRALQALAVAAGGLERAVKALSGVAVPALPETGGVEDVTGLAEGADAEVAGWTERLAAEDWGELATALGAHYRIHGAGPLARYRAFRWRGGAIEPVRDPDVPAPNSLVGYEVERGLLHKNTAQFAAGYPANSVLLYGDRGTGKSSSVKALLHPASAKGTRSEEAWQRLRLIEVPKGRLGDFPEIVARLRGRPQRFILFVDDLSFEDGETEYTGLKALLEGGIEARPPNVVVYATSNRRHLIREKFSDRAAPDSEEVHARDTVEEKLSFADRFGITITFATPNQEAYLAIVEGLAAQRGLRMERAALRARAIEWAAWHNGRSGRTARQLVDYLEGELGLGAAGADGGGG